MRTIIKTLLLIISVFILVSCNNKVVEEAKRTEEDKGRMEEEELSNKDINTQQKAIIKNGSSIREAKREVEKNRESKETITIEKVKKQKKFSEPDLFAQYVALILYNFQVKKIGAESYYDFLINYGSKAYLKGVDTSNAKSMIDNLYSLQESLYTSKSNYKGYKISELTTDKTGLYAYFYRTVLDKSGKTYYKTTIVKNGGHWKFDDDSLSSGYNEIDKKEEK